MALDLKPDDLKPGDIVRLKKPHPCGGYLWRVNRTGGDIGCTARPAATTL